MALFPFPSTFQKMPYGCLFVKLKLQRYEAEAYSEDFLEHAEHDNVEIAYLARILQEKCLSLSQAAAWLAIGIQLDTTLALAVGLPLN